MRSEAVARADQALRDIKIDPETYEHAATITYTFDAYTNEYLRRKISIAAANRIYRDQVPSAFWTIRYFRDSQNEEYMVVLQPDGSLHSVHHTLDEKAPGANLSKEEALARAEAYLSEQKKIDLSGWRLVETNTDKKPARTDHTFEWEQNSALDPGSDQQGAHIRMQLHVQGDEVSGYRVRIKIPEAWGDAETRKSAAQIAQTFGRGIGIAFVLIAVLVIFLRNLKSAEIARIPWHAIIKWSLWMLLAAIVISINRAPQLLANYTTTMPLAKYYATLAISLLFIVSLYLAVAVLLLGVSWFFLERAFGRGCIPAWPEDAGRVLSRRALRGNLRLGSIDGSRSPAGIVRALAGAAAHAGRRSSRRTRPAQPCCRRDRNSDYTKFPDDGIGWFGGRTHCRVCSSDMDAHQHHDSVCRADGHQRRNTGRIFGRGCVSIRHCCSNLGRSDALRAIQRDGLFPACSDGRACFRRI